MGKGNGEESLNEYERFRREGMAKNKARLEEHGVKNILQSLTNMMESSKSNKRKENLSGKTNHSNKDLDYLPGSDEEEDDHVNAGVRKKVT